MPNGLPYGRTQPKHHSTLDWMPQLFFLIRDLACRQENLKYVLGNANAREWVSLVMLLPEGALSKTFH